MMTARAKALAYGYTPDKGREELERLRQCRTLPQGIDPLLDLMAKVDPLWPRFWPLLVEEHGEPVAVSFMEAYEEHEEVRVIAVRGTIKSNESEFHELVFMAQILVTPPYSNGMVPPDYLVEELGKWLAERINSGDHTRIRNLAKYLNDLGDPLRVLSPAPFTEDGRLVHSVFRAFSELFVKAGRLPTSTDIREALGISPETDDSRRTDFQKYLKAMGLCLLDGKASG